MFARFAFIKKALAIISISALAVFGINTIAHAEDPTSTVTLSQGSFSSSSVTTNQVCFNFTGLDGSGYWVFDGLALTANDGETPLSVDFTNSETIQSDDNGNGTLCLTTSNANVADAGITDFTAVTDIALSGSARSAVGVVATFKEGNGDATTGSYSGYLLTNNTLNISVSELAAGLEVIFSDIQVVAYPESGTASTVDVADYVSNENTDGAASLLMNSLNNGALSSLDPLSSFKYFDVSFTATLGDAITSEPPTGNLVQSFGTFDATAVLDVTVERAEEKDNIQTDFVCWAFKGATPNGLIKASGVAVTLDQGLDTEVVWEDLTEDIQTDESGDFAYCFQSTLIDEENPPDISQFATIELSTITFASEATVSGIFAQYAESRGFQLDMAPSVDYQNWASTDRTAAYVELKNDTDSRLAYRVVGLQIGTSELSGYDPLWVVQAQSSTYINLGNAPGNKKVGVSSIDIWAMVKPVTASSLNVRGLKLPAGIQVVGDPLDQYYYGVEAGDYANKTQMSLTLRNTTDNDVTISGALTWKVGSSKLKSVGSQVLAIPAGETATFYGSNSVQALAAGDVRYGKSLTVSGTLKSVAANEVDEADFVYPEEVTNVTWFFDYNDSTKKTTVGVVLGTPINEEDYTLNDYRDLRAIGEVPVKIGTKLTGTSPVAAVPGQSGGWTEYIPRYTVIGTLPGDQRFGKSIAVTAEFVFSDQNPSPNVEELTNAGLDMASCGFYTSGYDWELNVKNGVKRTTVSIACYNYNNFDVKLNFSGMSGSYLSPDDGETVINMTRLSGISNIKLKKNQFQMIKIFDAVGDLRTGGIRTTFTGAIGFSR